MNHVGTHPDILEVERNGLPEGEQETLQCEVCEEIKLEDKVKDMRICDKCIENSASYDMTVLRNTELRNAIYKALEEIIKGEYGVAIGRLRAVLEITK